VKALLIAIGSHGDVHPFVGLGLTLRARGHDVTVVANGHFEPLVRRVGLGFAPAGTDEQYQFLARVPELWHPRRGFHLIMQNTLELLRPVYEFVADQYVPGETVVVTSTLGMGARIAQEKLGIPMATVHLQPAGFRSVREPPRLPGSPIRAWQPAWMQHAMWWLADKLVIDPALAGGINAFRAELGLAPVKRIIKDWWNSPELVIGMFPDWFARPQPDWPAQTRLTGFPLYDEKGLEPLSESLVRFLDSGDPPIAFTPGSAMWQGRAFFDAAVGTCRQLGRRGLLLSRSTGHIPPALPPEVIHVPFAPFSELLPRCAAIVHHGGIGTSSQGLAAGIPQLVTPMAHDQPDNAERLKRLGVGRWLWVKQFKPSPAARLLDELLTSPEVAAACRNVRARLQGVSPLEDAARLIEGLVDGATTQRDAPAGRRFSALTEGN
jgi:UDP:flavonoid glycosyltransferase YjiC (YdhE family)